jgi:para-nitrobenzyl esterase
VRSLPEYDGRRLARDGGVVVVTFNYRLDVPLVFGDLDRGRPAMLIGETPSPEAEALSARMRAAWVSFAAHGERGWPAYDTGQRLVQLFDTRPAATAYPEESSRLIWQSHPLPVLPLSPAVR